MDKNMMEKVYLLSKGFIQEYCPQELDFFKRIFPILKEILLELSTVPPDQWIIGVPDATFTRDLGLTDTEFFNILSLKITTTISATQTYIGNRSLEAIKDKIPEIVENFGKKFKVPQKFREILKESYSPMLSKIIEKLKEPPSRAELKGKPIKIEYDYLLWINGKPHCWLTSNYYSLAEVIKNKNFALKAMQDAFWMFGKKSNDPFTGDSYYQRMLIYCALRYREKEVFFREVYNFATSLKKEKQDQRVQSLSRDEEKQLADITKWVYIQKDALCELCGRALVNGCIKIEKGKISVTEKLTSCLILFKTFHQPLVVHTKNLPKGHEAALKILSR